MWTSVLFPYFVLVVCGFSIVILMYSHYHYVCFVSYSRYSVCDVITYNCSQATQVKNLGPQKLV
jgi:hypothetical protein